MPLLVVDGCYVYAIATVDIVVVVVFVVYSAFDALFPILGSILCILFAAQTTSDVLQGDGSGLLRYYTIVSGEHYASVMIYGHIRC